MPPLGGGKKFQSSGGNFLKNLDLVLQHGHSGISVALCHPAQGRESCPGTLSWLAEVSASLFVSLTTLLLSERCFGSRQMAQPRVLLLHLLGCFRLLCHLERQLWGIRV